MFIRCTTIKSNNSGESYKTYRIVESERIGQKVQQKTLLNLGRHFDIEKADWMALTNRIEELVYKKSGLFPIPLDTVLETLAQRFAAQIISRNSEYTIDLKPQVFETVDIGSLEIIRPRSIGVEAIALEAINQYDFTQKLQELKFNSHEIAAALGNVVARMARPTSERATLQWLQKTSGLGELIDYDYEKMGLDRLYHVSDLLWKNKETIESHLFQTAKSIFNFEETITLYDLTNTFFEGNAAENPIAKRGRSKEKRSDRPLVTLGLVLDGSGFPRKSEIFPGNASEPQTMAEMLKKLNTGKNATVIMDAGISSEANIQWLIANGYNYIVVARRNKRQFDEKLSVEVKNTENQKVRVQKVVNPKTGEVELFCHSEMREKKETGIQTTKTAKFEAALENLNASLQKKNTTKDANKILERIGRLKEKYSKVAQNYQIDVIQTEDKSKIIKVKFTKKEKVNTQASHPGVYSLRSNLADWNETKLWNTYTMLTDLESVFRSLKSELGMRPIYHRVENRINGHIFITLIAYYFVQTIRKKITSLDTVDSWQTIRAKMISQQRVTVTLKKQDGKTIHIRKTTTAEPEQQNIYDALEMSSLPGKTQKTEI